MAHEEAELSYDAVLHTKLIYFVSDPIPDGCDHVSGCITPPQAGHARVLK